MCQFDIVCVCVCVIASIAIYVESAWAFICWVFLAYQGKEHSMTYYLPIAGGRIVWYIHFPWL